MTDKQVNKTTEVFESKNSNYSSTEVERALKLAEEALEELHYSSGTVKAVTLYKSALAAIREALAEPVKQEPVAIISKSAIGLVKLHSNGACLPFGTPLYAAPVSAEAIRSEALEEAAKVCESTYPTYESDQFPCFDTPAECAAAIRGLK